MEYDFPITSIVNEDGTSMDDYPINPLKEKWDKKYPPTRFGKPCGPYFESRVYPNYGCILCTEKCQYNSYWEVPEEDIEEWNKYQEKTREYDRIHNPKLYKLLTEGK